MDEVIVPRRHNSWAEMMAEVVLALNIQHKLSIFLGESAACQRLLQMVFQECLLPRQHDGQYGRTKTPQRYSCCTAHDEPCVQVAYLGRELQIQNDIGRSANYTPPGHYVKCFHNTEHVLTLHNHFPTRCLGKQVSLIRGIYVVGCNSISTTWH